MTNEVQTRLLELKDKGWTMAAISDELGVTHMTVYRWQKGMRKAENSRSVLHMLDTLMERRKVPKRRRVGARSVLTDISTRDGNGD